MIKIRLSFFIAIIFFYSCNQTEKGKNILEDYRDFVISNLKPAEQTKLIELEENNNSEQIAFFWSNLGEPGISAYYYEHIAKKNKTKKNWQIAANNYFRAQKRTIDKELFYFYLKKSIYTLNEVIKLDPEDISARADLAICYYEGNINKVKAVGILRQNLEMYPKNKKTLFYLGIINLYEKNPHKAISRFEEVLKQTDTNNANIHYYMAIAYQEALDTQNAIKELQIFSIKTDDNIARDSVEKIIFKLNK